MHVQDDPIFVSIASYRDAQLGPTIRDCVRKARWPERLRFGICWQHGDEAFPETYLHDERFRILDVDWRDSRGACWARAAIMGLWQQEPWFLQVDSHCRFSTGWDVTLVEAALALESPKPILSTYATPFRPGVHEVLEEAPLQIAFQGFTAEGIPHMKPLAIPRGEALTRARRARFVSAGFLFAPGSFVEEVPYDPGLYFLGEEFAMTVRAFTSGYDLFHPCQTVVWHDYVRESAVKHWEDHTQEKRTDAEWTGQDTRSKDRVVKLMSGQRLDDFNLGTARTLEDYEAYAGISLSARRVQDYTLRSEEPPNPPADPSWDKEIFTWLVRVAVPVTALAADARTDAVLWYIGIHDELGNEIYRRDLTQAEVQSLPEEQPQIILICELQSGTVPAAWTVWPVTHSRGWLNRVRGTLTAEDYTVVLEEAGTSEAVAS